MREETICRKKRASKVPQNLAGSLAPIGLQKPCQNVSGAAATQVCRKGASKSGRQPRECSCKICGGARHGLGAYLSLLDHNPTQAAQNRRDSGRQLWPFGHWRHLWWLRGSSCDFAGSMLGRLRRYLQFLWVSLGLLEGSSRRLRPFARAFGLADLWWRRACQE